jgi:diketogulonate reductase-like aldo/keto reductase
MSQAWTRVNSRSWNNIRIRVDHTHGAASTKELRNVSPLIETLNDWRALAVKYGKSPAQVILRWHLDNGLLLISKSVQPARIEENFRVFDFSLDAEDLARMRQLDRPDGRLGPDPETAEF